MAARALASETTITGTIFCDNYFEAFYLNGELIATDPIESMPHQPFVVTMAMICVCDTWYGM
jgi:hypothetical protein